MSRVPRPGGQFISPKDIQGGEIVTIKTEADWIDSQFTKDDGTKQQQYVCEVSFNGEDRRLKLTLASCDELSVFGSDSADWIGNKIKLETVKVMVGGKMKDSIYATPVIPETQTQQEEEKEGINPETGQAWDE